MCFQNLLLGGPVIVVLEQHSPRKCRLFSPAEDVSSGVWGERKKKVKKKKCIYTKENKCSEHFPVFTVEPVELNDTKYLRRRNKAAIFWRSTLSIRSSSWARDGSRLTPSLISLKQSHIREFAH